MSNSGNGLKNEAIREIAATDLTSVYQDLGGPLLHRAFIPTIVNNTNCDVYVRRLSDAAVGNSKRLPPETQRVTDAKANDAVELAGTQFQVCIAGDPPEDPSGTFWIEIEYV
jgi:hypothetical protein